MKYVALGDSISIDYYTGTPGGGAASQFAKRIEAERPDFQNLTRDGNTTYGVEEDLAHVKIAPDVITLTVGGNNFLIGEPAKEIAARIEVIARELRRYGCPVLMNTVYDPSDGDDSLAEEIGTDPKFRRDFDHLNARIQEIARAQGFLVADLERLFHGHGIRSRHTWFVNVIEPNLQGATAIAEHWHRLWERSRG